MITHPATKLLVNDLTVLRGTRIIFQNLGLAAGAGEALTVTGPNGAGKTTLLRCIAGFLPAAYGEIKLAGGDEERTVGEQAHYIGHLNGIKPALTVSENLRFFTDFLGQGSDPEAAAERLGLAVLTDIPAAYLSAGQKRRLGLARLACAHRPLWLLDEPAVSLDVASQNILKDMVAEHLRKGGIVVAVTHVPLGWAESRRFDFSMFSQRAGATLQ
jgi:heme exporter protein A